VASIVRYQPLRFPLNVMTRDLDRIIDRLFDDASSQPRRGAQALAQSRSAANLYETSGAYLVELPLAGVRPEDVEVTVQENVVTLKAKRTWQAPENAKPIWQGFGEGQLHQSFTLPGEVNPDTVSASLEHGVLRLELPKAEHTKPRTIRVNSLHGASEPAIINPPADSEADGAPESTTGSAASGETHAS